MLLGWLLGLLHRFYGALALVFLVVIHLIIVVHLLLSSLGRRSALAALPWQLVVEIVRAGACEDGAARAQLDAIGLVAESS